jgi:hypothetical protein
MKITAVRVFRLEGEMEHPEPFWEERRIRPIDLVKWNPIHQFFLRGRIIPQIGSVALPTSPGLGMEPDEAKIRERQEVRASS